MCLRVNKKLFHDDFMIYLLYHTQYLPKQFVAGTETPFPIVKNTARFFEREETENVWKMLSQRTVSVVVGYIMMMKSLTLFEVVNKNMRISFSNLQMFSLFGYIISMTCRRGSRSQYHQRKDSGSLLRE